MKLNLTIRFSRIYCEPVVDRRHRNFVTRYQKRRLIEQEIFCDLALIPGALQFVFSAAEVNSRAFGTGL